MIANYHTHTPRCNHALGTEKEYAEAAFQAGLKILGFSDHGPYYFPGSYYSRHRMRPEELSDYVEKVLALRREYAGRMEIPLGVEMEYYPHLFSQTLPMLRDGGIEYMLLGQHWLGDEMDEPYVGRPTDKVEDLKRYCNQAIEGMQTGLFSYLAHPDVLNFVGDEKVYLEQMGRICREAKSCGLPLEWNLLGMTKRRNYPNIRFWELAAQEGCVCILGRDAHDPQALLDGETEARAVKTIDSLGLHLLDKVPLRRIG